MTYSDPHCLTRRGSESITKTGRRTAAWTQNLWSTLHANRVRRNLSRAACGTRFARQQRLVCPRQKYSCVQGEYRMRFASASVHLRNFEFLKLSSKK